MPLLAPVISRTGSLIVCRHRGDSRQIATGQGLAIIAALVDPQRKRKIRLVVALSVAVLLAVALVYTSFSASTEAKEPSQLLSAAPGTSYDMTGKVVPGSIRHDGERLASASPTAKAAARACRSPTAAPSPTLSAAAARSSSPARSSTAPSSANATPWSPSARRSSRLRMTASFGSVAPGACLSGCGLRRRRRTGRPQGRRALGRPLPPRRLRLCALITSASSSSRSPSPATTSPSTSSSSTPRSRPRPSTRWRRCGRARKARCCSGPGCSRSPPRSPSTRPATGCARWSPTRPR